MGEEIKTIIEIFLSIMRGIGTVIGFLFKALLNVFKGIK